MPDYETESDSEQEEESPGARTVWFGNQHRGTRLDEVPEDYKAWCIHPLQKAYRWYEDFLALHKAYEAWRARDGKHNPGSVIVWWGEKYKGQEFRKVYGRTRYMSRLLSRENEGQSYYYRVEELAQQYAQWLNGHRRGYRPRQRDTYVERGISTSDYAEGGDVSDEEPDSDPDGFIVSDKAPLEYVKEHGATFDHDMPDDGDRGGSASGQTSVSPDSSVSATSPPQTPGRQRKSTMAKRSSMNGPDSGEESAPENVSLYSPGTRKRMRKADGNVVHSEDESLFDGVPSPKRRK